MLVAFSRSLSRLPPLLKKQEHKGKNNDEENHNHSQDDAPM
jgi:hypothetical protein